MSKKHYKKISENYRASGKGYLSPEEVEAYVEARMPATKAAIGQVLSEITHFPIQSLVDVGAGTGGASLAAKGIFPALSSFTLIEENPAMAKRGEQFLAGEWVLSSAQRAQFPEADLVVFGYSFGEMGDLSLLEKGWKAAQTLVIVEPGTPRGFEIILRARTHLLSLGAPLYAPCPHEKTCPSPWCHFSARLERSREHRHLKEGKLGYEDEKFSYVIFSKRERTSGLPRVVRTLCTRQKFDLMKKTR